MSDPSPTVHAPLRALPALLSTCLAVGACYTGVHEGPEVDGLPPDAASGGDDEVGDDEPGSGVDAACAEADVLDASTASLRRLTRAEYRNSVDDLLGMGEAAEVPLSGLSSLIDDSAGGFAVAIQAPDEQVVRKYMEVAEGLAAVYVQDHLPQILTCDWAEPECAEQLLGDLGRRTFRRPLDGREQGGYLELHASILDQDGPEAAMTAVVGGLLSSPSFLYREEAIDPERQHGGLVRLSPHALASRLSFLLWSSGPDDALLDAAAAGQLDDEAGVAAQVERMMADPRFSRTLHSFHEQWMALHELDDVDRDDPAWSEQLRSSMREETLRFVEHVYLEGDGRLDTLLAAPYSFVDAPLAELYGIEPPEQAWSRVELPDDERAGLLTHASVLTQFGTVFPEVHRGKFVLQQLLCGTMPDPPEDVELDPEVDRLKTAPCSGCHIPNDSIGMGLLRYDSMGRFRTVDDAGGPIDDQGTIISALTEDGGDLTFYGAPELAGLLSDEPRVAQCMARQWTRYAMGRQEALADRCSIDAFSTRMIEGEGDLRQLLIDITTSTWFASRSAADFE